MSDYKEYLLKAVYSECAGNGSFAAKVIEAATAGVREFSNNQKDGVSQARFILMDVLLGTEAPRSENFTTEQIAEFLQPAFGGTESFDKLKQKLEQKFSK